MNAKGSVADNPGAPEEQFRSFHPFKEADKEPWINLLAIDTMITPCRGSGLMAIAAFRDIHSHSHNYER